MSNRGASAARNTSSKGCSSSTKSTASLVGAPGAEEFVGRAVEQVAVEEHRIARSRFQVDQIVSPYRLGHTLGVSSRLVAGLAVVESA